MILGSKICYLATKDIRHRAFWLFLRQQKRMHPGVLFWHKYIFWVLPTLVLLKNYPSIAGILVTLGHSNIGRAQLQTGKAEWKMQLIVIMESSWWLAVARTANRRQSYRELLKVLRGASCAEAERYYQLICYRMQSPSIFHKGSSGTAFILDSEFLIWADEGHQWLHIGQF